MPTLRSRRAECVSIAGGGSWSRNHGGGRLQLGACAAACRRHRPCSRRGRRSAADHGARISDIAGPATSGPSPVDQSTSVARSFSPVTRFLKPRNGGPVFLYMSARVVRLSGGVLAPTAQRPPDVLAVDHHLTQGRRRRDRAECAVLVTMALKRSSTSAGAPLGVGAEVLVDELVEVEAGPGQSLEEVAGGDVAPPPSGARRPAGRSTSGHHVGAVHCSGVSVLEVLLPAPPARCESSASDRPFVLPRWTHPVPSESPLRRIAL